MSRAPRQLAIDGLAEALYMTRGENGRKRDFYGTDTGPRCRAFYRRLARAAITYLEYHPRPVRGQGRQ